MIALNALQRGGYGAGKPYKGAQCENRFPSGDGVGPNHWVDTRQRSPNIVRMASWLFVDFVSLVCQLGED